MKIKSPWQKLSKIKRDQEEKVAQGKAAKFGADYLNLDLIPINLDDLVSVPEDEARRAKIAIIKKEGYLIALAMFNLDSPEAENIVFSFEKQGFKVKKIAVSLSSLNNAWNGYKSYKPLIKELKNVFIIEEDFKKNLNLNFKNKTEIKERLYKMKDEKEITDIITLLFIGATQSNASDIHIEPEENIVNIRFRIDGVLENIGSIENIQFHRLLMRIKILTEMRLNVKDLPQDGRFSIKDEDKSVDIRVSIIPSSFGETLVMRILGSIEISLKLEELGFEKNQLNKLTSALGSPNGLILSTGPTGSGKTTTLYSALNYIKTSNINIITIENPIEYIIKGITQTQVNYNKDYTFAKGLRAILRQDPDVILVGEIRDEETADVAINASLTGHLVLSTLHTNDAPTAIERLENLGVKEELIVSAISVVMAQRLVRKLCEKCKEEYEISEFNQNSIREVLSLISPRSGIAMPDIVGKMMRAKGCNECFGTGYKGRTSILEIFSINDRVQETILKKKTTYELRVVLMEEGMITLLQHGLIKAIQQITSLDEIERVTGDSKDIENLYGKIMLSVLSRSLNIRDEIVKSVLDTPFNIDIIKEKIEQVQEQEFLEWILGLGKKLDASDIHLSPNKQELDVSFRIDGILYGIGSLPISYLFYISSKIKELAKLDIGVHQKVQEGRFSFLFEKQSIDIRLSIIPGSYGEVIVMRLLQGDFVFTLEKLGVNSSLVNLIKENLAKPNGMILTTGPTGAGKTTTMYSILKEMSASLQRKIVTIENPIEYKIKGALQTQVDEEKGYQFKDALKAILRQDPDVIMVGEIRDNETASIAIQSAGTGHLVLSTLHTNDALGVIERIQGLDIGIELFSPVINLIFSQQMVRKLCDTCKVKIELKQEETQAIKNILSTLSSVFHYASVNMNKVFKASENNMCDKCNNGYKGRIGIFEVVFINDEIREAIKNNNNKPEIKKLALKNNGIFLEQDALLKLLQGITSLEEIERVLGKVI
ncbi:MAG: GspE/PulE family protein [Patescibacteria group bacterium]